MFKLWVNQLFYPTSQLECRKLDQCFPSMAGMRFRRKHSIDSLHAQEKCQHVCYFIYSVSFYLRLRLAEIRKSLLQGCPGQDEIQQIVQSAKQAHK